MKVDNITDYHSLVPLYKPKNGLESKKEGQLCEDKSVNRGYYSGSSVSFGSAAKLSSKLPKFLTGCNHQQTIIQNLIALGLALGPRPLAILSLPGKKNKEDKIYASGHSIASGLIGFMFSCIVTYPIGLASQKIGKDFAIVSNKINKRDDIKLVARRLEGLAKKGMPEDKMSIQSLAEDTVNKDEVMNFLKQFGEEKDGKLVNLKTKDAQAFEKAYKEYGKTHLSLENLKEGTKFIKDKFLKMFMEFNEDGTFKALNRKRFHNIDHVMSAAVMAPDTFVFGILKSMLTIALIPPILKYVFGVEKNKPAQKPAQAQQPAQVKADDKKDNEVKTEGGTK